MNSEYGELINGEPRNSEPSKRCANCGQSIEAHRLFHVHFKVTFWCPNDSGTQWRDSTEERRADRKP